MYSVRIRACRLMAERVPITKIIITNVPSLEPPSPSVTASAAVDLWSCILLITVRVLRISEYWNAANELIYRIISFQERCSNKYCKKYSSRPLYKIRFVINEHI